LVKSLVINMHRVISLLLVVSMTTAYTIRRYDDHCHKLECPKYKVMNSTDAYEIRQYPSFKWATASSHQKSLDYKDANKKNFMKLFRYISGNNVEKKKIEMTAPVLVHVPVTQGPFCAPDFTMHFFVPYEFQSNPPQPVNDTDQVKIMELPEMTVFVTSFGGWMTTESIQEHATALGVALKKDGVNFDDTQLFTAGYDSPFTLFGRHNEIMFLPKNNPFKV